MFESLLNTARQRARAQEAEVRTRRVQMFQTWLNDKGLPFTVDPKTETVTIEYRGMKHTIGNEDDFLIIDHREVHDGGDGYVRLDDLATADEFLLTVGSVLDERADSLPVVTPSMEVDVVFDVDDDDEPVPARKPVSRKPRARGARK